MASDMAARTRLVPPHVALFKLCASNKSLLLGKQVHAQVLKCNPSPTVRDAENNLVFLYGKCGSLSDAHKVFDGMHGRGKGHIFAWNAMIGACASNGEPWRALKLHRQARARGARVDAYSFPSVLKACSAVGFIHCGAAIHGLAVKHNCDSIVFVANSLLSMYAKCSDLHSARKLFDEIRETNDDDDVTWNSMTCAYFTGGRYEEALRLAREMVRKDGTSINAYTLAAALQSAGDSSVGKKLGMEIHAAVLKSQSSQLLHGHVGNTLAAMYSRTGNIDGAITVFNLLDERDTVSWNTLIAGLNHHGLHHEAMAYFRDLQLSGLKPDLISITSILPACGRLGHLLNGKEIHAFAIKNGFDSVLHVGNTLVDMYSRCSSATYMNRTFYKMMPKRDAISWTTVMASHGASSSGHRTLQLLLQLQAQREEIGIDSMMTNCMLVACGEIKCSFLAKQVHGYALRRDLFDLVLSNTSVDVYGMCGNIDYAARMFKITEHKDVVTWTSMVCSYVRNGHEKEAIGAYHAMLQAGIEPDCASLVTLLSAMAAGSSSSRRKGTEIHGFVVRKGFSQIESIENSLVAMYACCGYLQHSHRIFDLSRNKNLLLYTTMMNAYGMHGHGKAAIGLFFDMKDQNLAADHVTFLALLCACSHSGLVDEARKLVHIMKGEYGLEPWPDHYACLVDILARANCIEEARGLVEKMTQVQPAAEAWCALLGACRASSNQEIGAIAAWKLMELQSDNPGNHVLVANVFASCGRWNEVEAVRTKMKGRGLNKSPGCSWLQMGIKSMS